MAKPLVDDERWAIIEPLLPEHKLHRFRYPERQPIDNRRALTGSISYTWKVQDLAPGAGTPCAFFVAPPQPGV